MYYLTNTYNMLYLRYTYVSKFNVSFLNYASLIIFSWHLKASHFYTEFNT